MSESWREGILYCKLHQYPKFCKSVPLIVGSKTLGTLILFWLVGYKLELFKQ